MSFIDEFLSYSSLKLTQALSGLTFGSYLSLHIPTILSTHFGPFGFDESLRLFRNFYHNPIIETCILGAGVIHIASSAILYYKYKKENKSNLSTYSKITQTTGDIVGLFILGHFAGTRLESLLGIGEKSEYSHIRASLISYPFIFFPYYITLSVCGFVHFCCGFMEALRRLRVLSIRNHEKIKRSKLFWSFIALGSIAMISSIIAVMRIPGIEDREAFWSKHLTSRLRIFG